MRKNLLAVGLVFLVALLLVGLTFSSTVEDRADYILINGTEPKSLDPAKVTGQPEGRLLDALFEGLTYRHPATLQPTPGAAIRWDISPDGSKYVFHIRPGQKWHNGDPVTAHDFAYAWRRFLQPKMAAEYAYLIHPIRHAQAFNEALPALEGLLGEVVRDGSQMPVTDEAGAPSFAGGGALEQLAQAEPAEGGAMPAGDWQALLGKLEIKSHTVGVDDPALAAGIAAKEGDVSADVRSAFRTAVQAHADRLLPAWIAANRHLGVDQGFWSNEAGTEFHVELAKFTPYFMELTCFYPLYPVNRKVVEANPETWFLDKTFVGNGPFRLAYWHVNRKIRVLRNDEHWDAPNIALRHADFLPLEGQNTQMNVFLTGEADWAPSGYPPDVVDVVQKKPYFYSNRGFIVYYYRINVTEEHLSDKRVRQALSMGFSRHVICTDVLAKGDVPTSSFVPPGVEGYESPPGLIDLEDDATPGMPKSVARANQLLDEAGYPRNADGVRDGLETIGILHNTLDTHERIAERIAYEWRANLGVRAVPINKEWQSYLAAQRTLDYHVSRAGWIGDYLDPKTFLDMWLTGGGNNQTGWGDPRYDRLVGAASDIQSFLASPDAVLADLASPERVRAGMAEVKAAGTDPEALYAALNRLRFALFREAEAILVNDACPVIPIYTYQVSGLVADDVEGFHTEQQDASGKVIGPNLKDLHPIRYVRTARTPAR